MGQENSKCSCFNSNEERNTAMFDKEKNQSGVINSNLIISNHQMSDHENNNQQSNSETNSFKDLKTYISFKNAIDSTSIPVISSSKETENNSEQLVSTKVKKHTSILVHQGLMKKEEPPSTDTNKKTDKCSTGKKSKMFGFHKSKSVNPFSGLKKDILLKGQKLYRGYIYRKKYKQIKQDQIDYTYQLIKDLYSKYVTQKIIDMETSIGIKHDKNSWKSLIARPSIGLGSALVTDLKLFTRLKITHGKEEAFYVGEVNLNNQLSGKGILIKSNGSKYDGSWEKNKFNGIGRIINSEGSLFEGFFIDGKLNGQGTKKTLDGAIYVGDFKNHLKEGKGKEESKETLYEGNFVSDKKNGKGTLVYKLLNDVYEGNFIDNNLSGEGKYIWNNKETYQGTFKNGKMEGKGLFKWADGGKYEGEYANNVKEGQGRYRWSNGKIFVGSFKKGKPWGDGVLHVKNKEYNVKFKEGKIVGKLKEIIKEKQKESIEEEEDAADDDNNYNNELDYSQKDINLFKQNSPNISLQDKFKNNSSSNDDYSP